MKAQLCANAAEAAVTKVPPITYQMEDCQAFIEQTVKRAGGSIKDYRGSNDMIRNACTKVIPIASATLEPGMVLFIVKHDGGEPAIYKDSMGNASHVGWYTGGIYKVVHSSQSVGKVAASTLQNGWTHAGYLKGLEYLLYGAAIPGTGIIILDAGIDKAALISEAQGLVARLNAILKLIGA